ncbi:MULTISPECIES: hypothetical protein [Thiorhodovibrio]|uniref:hypothetical protein n=1 Tax=Thiorhodovibrio TaxID=61593 RepID=UPI0019141087|nr:MULTISPECIES: hypothetical protein [Thiorhodovibrio]MBK5969190.1 hypothetical protein [Thiorhodovibrio winogradskyi]WPL11180.1 hypothetical protein Thiosp_00908 [Thiorhodovibrio litoralis]
MNPIRIIVKAEEILCPLDEPITAAEPSTHASSPQRQPGSARGELTIIADDDEHLDDFKGYMP